MRCSTPSNPKSAAIIAVLDGGPMAMVFAALHPERVRSLLLSNTSAHYLVDDDYPIGATQEAADSIISSIRHLWGSVELARIMYPSRADDNEELQRVAKTFRAAATPRVASAQYSYIINNLDVRPMLPLIEASTVVYHSRANPVVPVEHGHSSSRSTFPERGSSEVTDPNVLVSSWVDAVDDLDEFPGRRAGRSRPRNRSFAVVLFTDIVGSTRMVAALGDRQWRVLLDRFRQSVRTEIRRYRGTEIKTRGDDFLIGFDGPARGIRCADAVRRAGESLGVDVRSGLHAGEVGADGRRKSAGSPSISGARGCERAEPGDIAVSRTIVDLVSGSGIEFVERGEHELEGLPGTWKLFNVARL